MAASGNGDDAGAENVRTADALLAASRPEHPRAKGGSGHGRHQLPHRVRDLIRSAVLAGTYSSGDQLIEEALVHLHGASRNAMRHALQQLLAEGVVSRAPRRGTYPSWAGARVHVLDVYRIDGGRMEPGGMHRELVASTPYLREKLQTDERMLRMVETTSMLGGEPLGIRTVYFSSRFDMETEARRGTSPITLAEVIAGIFARELGRVTTEISATVADAGVARILGVAPSSPVLRREQLIHDDDGRPVEIAFDALRADRATFTMFDDPHLAPA
ncbi:GntR family transcriptional regulator [Microbacterium sp. LWS13-1.2]|uniref:GntR family transcriptional regulator n=1 Tax=Microbacterium sp. LWS13-1.2 TaxID=3135264 RepID=A0AAU6SBJ1_9MICO